MFSFCTLLRIAPDGGAHIGNRFPASIVDMGGGLVDFNGGDREYGYD